MDFTKVIISLKEGKCVRRSCWGDKDMFIVKQKPSIIEEVVIPKMQSLPESAKYKILNNKNKSIYYKDQLLIIDNCGTAYSWNPNVEDIFAEDWIVI